MRSDIKSAKIYQFELVFQEEAAAETILSLEKALVGFFLVEESDRKAVALLQSFSRNCNNISIGEFCSNQDGRVENPISG